MAACTLRQWGCQCVCQSVKLLVYDFCVVHIVLTQRQIRFVCDVFIPCSKGNIMCVGLLGSKVITGWNIEIDQYIEICLRSMESVWEYVWLCISSCLSCTELKLDMGVGGRPPGFESIISKHPHQRSNVPQRSSCLRNVLWPPNLVGKTPDQRVMHCWGQRSFRSQPGSTRGQIA